LLPLKPPSKPALRRSRGGRVHELSALRAELKKLGEPEVITSKHDCSASSPHLRGGTAQLSRSALRLAEYGTCYRYEQSGELFGLMRVRSLT